MNTKHTPGKWTTINLYIWTEAGDSLIACVAGPRDEDPESLANAKLIAAAPELLEALQVAQATIERLHQKHSNRCACINGTLDVIKKAITKATQP